MLSSLAVQFSQCSVKYAEWEQHHNASVVAAAAARGTLT